MPKKVIARKMPYFDVAGHVDVNPSTPKSTDLHPAQVPAMNNCTVQPLALPESVHVIDLCEESKSAAPSSGKQVGSKKTKRKPSLDALARQI